MTYAPTIHLAFAWKSNPRIMHALQGRSPTIRLAATGGITKPDNNAHQRYMFHNKYKRAGGKALELAPTIRLAHVPGAQGDNSFLGQRGVKQLPRESAPSLLVSYAYLDGWMKVKDRVMIRDWVLDSGAFSVRNFTKTVNVKDYIKDCKHLMDTEPMLTEIYALDVIGDWKETLANTKAMWKAGVPGIPCFHLHEPWDHLTRLAEHYPKIAVGGMSRLKGHAKFDYAGQCFARVWPKPVHGFAVGGEDMMLRFPWHSMDATNWEMGPCAFGQWHSFGRLTVRGSKQDLRGEIEYYLNLEAQLRVRWRKEMKTLGFVGTLQDHREVVKKK